MKAFRLHWDPSVSNSKLFCLVFGISASDSKVFAWGRFNRIGGANRNHIATLDPVTGQAGAWNPDLGPDIHGENFIAKVAFSGPVDGNSIYVGGYFGSVGGEPRPYFAKFDAVAPPEPVTKAENWSSYH